MEASPAILAASSDAISASNLVTIEASAAALATSSAATRFVSDKSPAARAASEGVCRLNHLRHLAASSSATAVAKDASAAA